MGGGGSAVVRRQLGRRLRELRLAAWLDGAREGEFDHLLDTA